MKMASLLIGLFIVLACDKSEPIVIPSGCGPPYTGPLPRTILPLSSAHGLMADPFNYPKQNLVIRDQDTWSYWVTDVNLLQTTDLPDGQLEVDFNCEMIILTLDEAYGYAGYEIEILSVVEEDARILVTINRSDLGTGMPVMTQPFHLVKVPKLDKEVVFEE